MVPLADGNPYLVCSLSTDKVASPASLRTSSLVRQSAFAPLLPPAEIYPGWQDGVGGDREIDEMYDAAIFPPCSPVSHDLACVTPLPPPTPEEILFFTDIVVVIEEFEDDESVSLSEYSLVADDAGVAGVALQEASEERI